MLCLLPERKIILEMADFVSNPSGIIRFLIELSGFVPVNGFILFSRWVSALEVKFPVLLDC